ncbi:hypothetical protein H0H81_010405 [Sphagnurus paluster]|uniref:Uncharacterized protein n=1 Tax=Sphagnurus paluster TaxID=117069 RepID=A0A9P7FNZ4_9AGAR|nr:hypothetical protein H0H81_010405 [Sphagnurus paluster]
MTLSAEIPLEIIGSIIDLVRNDQKTLRNCALTSRFLAHRSQKWLFARVKLEFPPPSLDPAVAHIERFIEILNPKIASYINHLFINNYAQYTVAANTYHGEDTFLAQILPKLEKIQSLSICLIFYGGDMRSNQFSPALASLFIDTLASTEAVEVNIGRFDVFPVNLLASCCPCIKRLDFFDCFVRAPLIFGSLHMQELAPPKLDLRSSTGPRYLERLAVSDSTSGRMLLDATSLPNAVLSLERLWELEIRSIAMAQVVLDIMATSGRHLRRLICHFKEDLLGLLIKSQDLPPLLLLPTLRALCASIAFLRSPTPHFKWLRSALQASAVSCSTNSLEEFVLLVSSDEFLTNFDPTSTWDAHAEEYHALDLALSGRGYPHLRRVVIFVQFKKSGFQLDEHLMEPVLYFETLVHGLKTQLPLLCAKGILDVRWLVDETADEKFNRSTLHMAIQAVEEGIEGPVYVGTDGEFLKFGLLTDETRDAI